MPDGLYERDFLAWSERQAELLDRLAAGERVNDAVDWPHVVEEVRDLGLSELRACESLLRQAMLHLMKLWAWPDSTAANHWDVEATAFLIEVRRRYAASMRQRLDLDGLYADALTLARRSRDLSGEPRGLPDVCPFRLDELLTADAADLSARFSLD